MKLIEFENSIKTIELFTFLGQTVIHQSHHTKVTIQCMKYLPTTKHIGWAGEVDQQLKTLTAPPKDPSSGPSTYMAAHNQL